MSTLDDIKAIAAREPDAPKAWAQIVALPGTEGDTALLPNWNELQLERRAPAAADAEVAILGELRALEIAAAPEIAAVIPFGKTVLVARRYWACPDERLVHAETPGVKLSDAAKERFRADMLRLIERGKFHPYARSLGHVFVGERSGTIVMNAWTNMRAGDTQELGDARRDLDRMLK
jgi:hypothetical protein